MRRVSNGNGTFGRVVAVSIVMACGGSSTAPPVVPPPHETSHTPPAQRAKWVFSTPEREVRARLDLGDGRTLYVGEHGRREIESSGAPEYATTLAEDDLTGILHEKGRYVFVATDGDTWVSTEPLGPLQRLSTARTEPLTSVSAGRAAIVAIDKSGALVRSDDAGVTWKHVAYSPTKLFGKAASVALDGKGNGVLVHHPQRVFVTHDDGATWTPTPGPTHGAGFTFRDGADRLFVYGYHDEGAVLGSDKLEDTKDAPKPLHAGQSFHAKRDFERVVYEGPFRPIHRRFPPSPEDFELPSNDHTLLVGDHVVEVTFDTDKKTTRIRSAALGTPLPAETSHDDLGADAQSPERLAGFGDELAYLRIDTDEEAGPQTTLLRSKDYGATWQKADVFPGAPTRTTDLHVALGPRGWTYVATVCVEGKPCTPSQIRGAGKTAFAKVTYDGLFEPLAFAFDEAHDKVYALSGTEGALSVQEGALDGTTFTKTRLFSADKPENVSLAVDGEGTLRLFEHGGWRHLVMRRYTLQHEVLPTQHIAIPLGALSFAGRRGLMVSTHDAYETSDAGDTWTRVPSNGAATSLSCTDAGCVLRNAQRVGWDLPAVSSNDVVRATLTAPDEGTASPMPKPAITPVALTCKTAGKPTTIEPSTTNWIDGASATRWAHLDEDNPTDKVTLESGSKDQKATRVVLLGPQPAPTGGNRIYTGTTDSDNGLVAARYHFVSRSITGKMNPVTVDLAWWSAATGKTHHGTVTVAPFRVARGGFSGAVSVVDGGVLYRGDPDDAPRFVHDDGRVEALSKPGIPISEAWHSGKRWVVLDSDNGVIELAASDDGGKTWMRHGWGFGPIPYALDGYLETAGGKLVLRALDGLFDVGWPVSGDPPAPIALDVDHLAARCDGLTLGSTIHRDRIDGAPVSVDIDGKKLAVSDRVFHDSLSGTQCTTAYIFEDRQRDAYVYPETGGGWSGWLLSDAGDKTSAVPLACTP